MSLALVDRLQYRSTNRRIWRSSIHMKVCGIFCQSWLFAVHREQWTAICRNGEKAPPVAPTCIERRQTPKMPGNLYSAALQKPQIRLAGRHCHWR
ncbi:hypothetical protein RB195_017523 [Necator americanus]|uniref:Uncharacterized protein n=1 Tax=Necator americanus TaxID=51031 RepID=A0ABR1C5M4_NECAM